MSGGGIGGTLGSILGAALAPETGGLSLAIPALAGAGGAFLGGKLTGSKNPMMDALLGGVGGGLSGATGLGSELGIGNSAGLFGDAASGAGDAGAMLGSDGISAVPSLQIGDVGAGAADTGMNGAWAQQLGKGALDSNASPSILDQLGHYAVKNPLQAAVLGGSALSGIQSLLPQKKVNVGQNAADVMATNPSFNTALPQYSMQNTGTPYAGDWYKYGQMPQPAMYNATLQRMARGGMVKGYAAGGPAMMPPQGAPMQGVPMQSALPNPLALQTAHKVGLAIGQHLKSKMPTPPGQVRGAGGGQDDKVPAKLSQGEYIVPSDVTSQLGDGSSDAGGKKLDQMVHKVRAHKTSKGSAFPPKAKNPLAYVPKRKSK